MQPLQLDVRHLGAVGEVEELYHWVLNNCEYVQEGVYSGSLHNAPDLLGHL